MQLPEKDGFRPHGRLGELGKDDACHARLQEEACQVYETKVVMADIG